MTDYERGVEQASTVYKEVIRVYVAENTKLRELVKHYANAVYEIGCSYCPYIDEYPDKCEPFKLYPYTDGCRLFDDMRELGIEVD